MFKITMPVPDNDTLRLIIDKQGSALSGRADDEGTETFSNNPLLPEGEEESREIFKALRERIQRVRRLPALKDHIPNMFLASNGRFGEMKGCSKIQKNLAECLVSELLTYGLGPRAAIALTLGTKAWSLLFSPDPNIAQADGVALARVVIPTLRHRIKLDLDWEDRYREIIDKYKKKYKGKIQLFGYTEQDGRGHVGLLERMLADFCCSTAPQTSQYQSTVIAALKQVLEERGW